MIAEYVFSRPLLTFAVVIVVAGFLGMMVGDFAANMVDKYELKPYTPGRVHHEPLSES